MLFVPGLIATAAAISEVLIMVTERTEAGRLSILSRELPMAVSSGAFVMSPEPECQGILPEALSSVLCSGME